MKKQLTTLAIGLAMAACGTSAFAEKNIDYWGAGLAMQSVSDLDSGFAVVANAGKKMPSVTKNFSWEGEFSYSLSPASTSSSFFGETFKTEVTVMTLAGYGVFSHEMNKELTLRARVGLLYESVDAKVTISGNSASGSETDTGLSYGFGAVYKMNNMLVTADYTVIEADVKNIGVGVQLPF